MSPSSSAVLPVVPPARGGDSRRRPRRLARGLTLTCTRASLSRASNPPNLSRELIDVGWGGVRFVCSEAVQLPCPVNLQIRDEASGEVFHARGEVAWVQARTRDGRESWIAGARFDEVLTPASKCALFFEGRRPGESESDTLPRPGQMRRARDRFPIDGCEATVTRPPSFWKLSKPANLARALVDLSRTGAQVVCTEPLKPGERVQVAVHLSKFKDTFEAEARVVWVAAATTAAGRAWRVGLEFGGLDRPRQVLLGSMESWYAHRGPRPCSNSKNRPPLA